MARLEHYLDPKDPSPGDVCYLSLIQPEINGGQISTQSIDVIQRHPHATEIVISGLTQETFEYFTERYAAQFEAINFWKCPRVADLQPIESLDGVKYLVFYWNQQAETLWDLSKTPALKGLAFDDFTRLHDIVPIAASPSLEDLQFGDRINSKFVLASLDPLCGCRTLRHLSFSAEKLLDERIEPLACLPNLETLVFPPKMFTTEQVAWLKAHVPGTVKSELLAPFLQFSHPWSSGKKMLDTLVIGKKKPFLDSNMDSARLAKYVESFKAMYQWYLVHPDAAPEEYCG